MKTSAERFIIYARVSTDEQGDSGLGLEAQLAACEAHVANAGGSVVRSFREVWSGTDDNRPELLAAMRLARRTGAVLLVSKLDRVSRAVACIANMMRDGVELRVAECPTASSFELHLRASFGEEERNKIAERTSAALGALKARGVKLGSARPGHWEGREHLRLAGLEKARAAKQRKTLAANADLYAEAAPIIERMQGESLRAIGSALEAAGVLTPKGSSKWTPTAVKRLRAALETSAAT